MKTLWLLLLTVLIAGATVLATRIRNAGGGASAGSGGAVAGPSAPPIRAASTAGEPGPAPGAPSAPTPTAGIATTNAPAGPAASTPAPAPTPAPLPRAVPPAVEAVAAPSAGDSAAPAGKPAATSEPTKPAEQAAVAEPPRIEDLLPTPGLDPDAARPAKPAPAAAAESVAASAAPAAGEPLPFTAAWPSEKVTPSRIERRDDGSFVLDGRFVVRGKGTADDPYQLPWPLVTSADETYNPRLGKTRLPQRITMFDGAYVEIDGYTAFPINATNATEMLVMLNQWDGCCIGTPPTAYDAVEVKLAQTPTREQRLAVHGTLRGRFKVDPYEDGGWLLGLYLLNDATLKTDH